MTDAYYRGTLWSYHVVDFSYFSPSAPYNDVIIICIDLVLPMGWVESPKFFCVFSETLTDLANTLIDMDLPVPAYGAISDLPSTGMGLTHTYRSLTHIYCYMDDVICAVQCGTELQQQVFDSIVRAIKWLLPSLPGEAKYSASVKKLLTGEGD